MKQNIIVLSAHPYRITENSGRVSEGLSVRYLTVDNLNPVKDGEAVGTRPAKANLPYSWKDLFISAPAMYEAELSLTVGSDGKPVMTIAHIDYVSDLTVSAVASSSPKAATK